ncbi:MAG: PEP-CTERM sorting domain-containing protein, partial [Gemmatimonadetes bacterium]|nr:PEP-CTERM sorting domain-containing protein [Gemmatimonadota bacterium]
GLSFATGVYTSGAVLNYGWIRVSVDQAAGTFTVHDWAYEDSGGGIQAGAVPAPGALGLLAVGASGLGLLRGRKRS